MHDNTTARKKCLIVSGGDFAPSGENPGDFGLIIACDRGYLNAVRAGIEPHVMIGDLDSFAESGADPSAIRCPVIELPVKKDDTDTLSAVRYALERDYTDITISCAFGGRFDHSMANIQTAAFIVRSGGFASVFGADTFAYAFSGERIALKKRDGYTLSVFSLTEKCENVSISGTLYEIENAELTHTFPIGVSNAWSSEYAEISVGKGILLVIASRE